MQKSKKNNSKKDNIPQDISLASQMEESVVNVVNNAVNNKNHDTSVDKNTTNNYDPIVSDPGFLKNDDVFDETDLAQWQQLREQAAIHARALSLNKAELHPDFDGIHCIECDDDIPAARLKLNKIRCVDCQADLEEEEKRGSRLSSVSSRKDDLGWSD